MQRSIEQDGIESNDREAGQMCVRLTKCSLRLRRLETPEYHC